MNDPNPDIVTIQRLLNHAKDGLNRFYADGYTKWPKATFQKMFGEVNIANPHIQSVLHEWEAAGLIRFVGRDDYYIEVLEQFPDWTAGGMRER